MTLLIGPIDADEFPRFHRHQAVSRGMVAVAEDYAAGRVAARLQVDVRIRPGINGLIGRMRIGIDSWVTPVEKTVRLTLHEPNLRGLRA
jgi:hypothetical protein